MAPIYLAMMFNYLEGMNNRLCSLLHGGKEIRENLIAVQKLLKLDDDTLRQDLLDLIMPLVPNDSTGTPSNEFWFNSNTPSSS